jgi:hypothetical protein
MFVNGSEWSKDKNYWTIGEQCTNFWNPVPAGIIPQELRFLSGLSTNQYDLVGQLLLKLKQFLENLLQI